MKKIVLAKYQEIGFINANIRFFYRRFGMGNEKYRVLFKGDLAEGAVLDDVKKKLASLFKTDIQKIDNLFTGQVKILKKNAGLDICKKTQRAFAQAGAECYINKEEAPSIETAALTPPVPQDKMQPPRRSPQNNPPRPHTAVPNTGKHCSTCGSRLAPTAVVCPECGTKAITPVNKTALLLLTFFMGGLGAHKFYIGKYLQGVLYLLFCWTLIPSLIAVVDFVLYAVTDTEKLQEKYEAQAHIAIIIVALGGCLMVGVAILGILAAIAIPNFIAYRQKAFVAAVVNELTGLSAAQENYYAQHSRYAANLDELDFVSTTPEISIQITSADDTCFEAVGSR